MQERYKIQYNFMNDDEEPYSYTVGYIDRYGGASYQTSWIAIETFYNKNIAERVCDELNAKRILDM